VHFLARGAQARERLRVKSQAAIAARGHADGQRDQLLGLGVDGARGQRRLAHGVEVLEDLGHALLELAHLARDGGGQLLVVGGGQDGAHGISLGGVAKTSSVAEDGWPLYDCPIA